MSKTSITVIQTIFPDEKQAKAVLAAAKRVNKKRQAGEGEGPSPIKRAKHSSSLIPGEQDPASLEESLRLPNINDYNISDEAVVTTKLWTIRAPLVLAFAVVLLKHTMPSQPLSSHLSLAQAVVSVNSRSKAVSLGLAEKGAGAEDEGWGMGQPSVKIMTREIKVMRRHGYDYKEPDTLASEGGQMVKSEDVKQKDADTQETLKQENGVSDDEPALWGLDLEALRSSKSSLVAGGQRLDGSGLPIYSAQNARSYLLKSFASPQDKVGAESTSNKKPTAAAQRTERERNLACLLRALDLVIASWAHVLSQDELDRRAWSWYVAVRPDVKDGVAGWGGKGEVSLEKIVGLRRRG